MKLMFDLQVLALETDMTRIISFKTGRDSQNRVFPESGSLQPFHPASHHGDREDRIMEFNKICKYRVSQVTYLLDKLKESMDGDKNLLEKSMIVWGSPMADPNVHNHRRCPLIVLGHANGALKGNLHIKAAADTPMANAFLTMGHALGMDIKIASATARVSSRSRRRCRRPPRFSGTVESSRERVFETRLQDGRDWSPAPRCTTSGERNETSRLHSIWWSPWFSPPRSARSSRSRRSPMRRCAATRPPSATCSSRAPTSTARRATA